MDLLRKIIFDKKVVKNWRFGIFFKHFKAFLRHKVEHNIGCPKKGENCQNRVHKIGYFIVN
jgi:hypothetical protein